mgnify:CR=1 FL=1
MVSVVITSLVDMTFYDTNGYDYVCSASDFWFIKHPHDVLPN